MQIKNVAILFYIGIAILMALLLSQAKVQKDLLTSADNAELSQTQAEVLNEILVNQLNLETGSRGYLITKNPAFLAPFNLALDEMPALRDKVTTLFKDDAFDPLVRELLEIMKTRAEAGRKFVHSGEILKVDQKSLQERLVTGKARMDRIREIIRKITASKDKDRTASAAENHRYSTIMIWVTVITSLAVFAFMYIASREVQSEIVKRSKSENELKINLSYLRTLTSSIPAGILALDKTGKVTFSNFRASELLSFNPDRIQGHYFANLAGISVDDRRLIEHALDHGEVVDIETTMGVHHSRFPSQLKMVPLHQRSELVGGVVTFQDISREKDLQAELVAEKESAVSASKAKSLFLSQMSHEFRTPLNAIIGMGEMLQQTKLSSEQMQYAKVLTGAAHNLLRLINDVLDMSKIEAGKLELDEAPFSLSGVLEECVKTMSYKASEKGIRTQLINKLYHDTFFGDSMRLHQVCMNLMGNALKFTEKGQVTMEVRQESGFVRIDVTDTGKGIAADKIGKIFEKYAQEDRGISRNYGGTGLGLSISRDIAHLMGGDLTAQSKPGIGSTFTLKIRLKPHASAIENLAGKDLHLKPMRILLVDDNADNRLVVTSYLKGQPVEVVEAADGSDAVEIALHEPFDLILMDMHMPIMDGYEATAAIRRHGNQTPIVALTAYALKEEIERILSVGCQDRLSKPITRQRLLTYLMQFQNDAPQAITLVEAADVDDDMKDLIPDYLNRRRGDIPKMAEWIKNRDLQSFRTLSHNLKGTALSYGQTSLDEWAHKLSTAVHAEDWTEIETLAQQYSTIIPKEV